MACNKLCLLLLVVGFVDLFAQKNGEDDDDVKLWLKQGSSRRGRSFLGEKDSSCYNEKDFAFLNMTCRQIEFSAESLRIDLCQNEDVFLYCPKACGRCCDDDPSYSILVDVINITYEPCEWIKEEPSRQFHWCNTFNNGRIVREGCPVSCDTCLEYLTMNPSDSPTTSFPPSTMPSPSPSSSPTQLYIPSDTPSDKPSSSPTDSIKPSQSPTDSPTLTPTMDPTENPTSSPTKSPTKNPTAFPTISEPNLIMIMTDEHNYRTLGCYRNYLRSIGQESQSRVWGVNWIYTPNIDRLSTEGALFSNFYSVSPICTPSRASFMSGLYPEFTGAAKNSEVMDANIVTFANILREQGYSTSYMGKWHLSGLAKPGWDDEAGRDFGFDRTRFKYNRGHWKYFEASDDNSQVYEYKIDDEGMFEGRLEEHYATDFLFDRGIEDIDTALAQNKPFAIVLAIPDPHGPNNVRPPFRDTFKDNYFEYPMTGKKNVANNPAPPKWHYLDHENIDPNDAEAYIDNYEQRKVWQSHMQQYFSMVECIDENVGKLLDHLEEKGIVDNSIVVFTADHGDLLGEHGKFNKGRPYETSAGVPFLIRYPNKIKPSKVIETAYSTVDFNPTILKLMDVDMNGNTFHGVDGSPELLSDALLSKKDNIIFSQDGSGRWAAAVTNGYKLVISRNDVPWLFDLKKDPDELYNYFENPDNEIIRQTLQNALFEALSDYKFPLGKSYSFLWDMPSCRDTGDAVTLHNGKKFLCTDLGVTQSMQRCDLYAIVRTQCPAKCSRCPCQDSNGKVWITGELKSCSEINQSQCSDIVAQFCPATCNSC